MLKVTVEKLTKEQSREKAIQLFNSQKIGNEDFIFEEKLDNFYERELKNDVKAIVLNAYLKTFRFSLRKTKENNDFELTITRD